MARICDLYAFLITAELLISFPIEQKKNTNFYECKKNKFH